MPITTSSAAPLVGGVVGGSKRRITFLKQTYVSSLGRNSAIGETQSVSAEDARFLIAYRYAVKAEDKAQEPVVSGQQEEAPVEVEEVAEVEESTDVTKTDESSGEPLRFFRGKGRRRGGE